VLVRWTHETQFSRESLIELLDGPPLGYEIERSSIMSRDSARDGHVPVREILVSRTLMLTNAREIEGYDDTRELDRWTLLIGVLT
jgi:hypothetical protein